MMKTVSQTLIIAGLDPAVFFARQQKGCPGQARA
jgi:hypothetical protein